MSEAHEVVEDAPQQIELPGATFEQEYPDYVEPTGEEVETVEPEAEATETAPATETPAPDELIRARDGVIAELQRERAALAEMRAHNARLQGYLEHMQQSGQKQEAEEVPDAATNPAEFLAHQIGQVQEQVGQLTASQKAEAAQAQIRAQQQYAANWVAQNETEYLTSQNIKPEMYHSALNHARKARLDSYSHLPRQQAEDLVRREEMALVGGVMQNGGHVAEVAMRMARQYGWNPDAVTPEGRPGPSPADVAAAAARAPQGGSVTDNSAPPGQVADGWVTLKEFDAMDRDDPRRTAIYDNPSAFKKLNLEGRAFVRI